MAMSHFEIHVRNDTYNRLLPPHTDRQYFEGVIFWYGVLVLRSQFNIRISDKQLANYSTFKEIKFRTCSN